ncbi:MAG: NYN domain-containing protein [Candidatus Roizmanbacteria bacterium]|nr:NYN domain-containing protein [Candidatus Roizmanbacteria bacterium]
MKTFLFIDGTNLYSAQYELFGPNKYLIFPKFIKEVEKSIKIKFDQIYFYASYSPQPKKPTIKEKHYLKNEALFYRSVKQTSNLFFFTGYRSKTSGKEKEVDVKLAVDIVDFAHQNKYEKVFLISGDADFMEALKVSQRIGKHTFVICIENKIMFKSLLFFKTYIIRFTNKAINFYKIRKAPFFVSVDKNKVVNQI